MKNAKFKNFQNLVIFGKIARTPKEEKCQILNPEKNVQDKGVNRSSVIKNIPGDTFQGSQGTVDKEIAQKRLGRIWVKTKKKPKCFANAFFSC